MIGKLAVVKIVNSILLILRQQKRFRESVVIAFHRSLNSLNLELQNAEKHCCWLETCWLLRVYLCSLPDDFRRCRRAFTPWLFRHITQYNPWFYLDLISFHNSVNPKLNCTIIGKKSEWKLCVSASGIELCWWSRVLRFQFVEQPRRTAVLTRQDTLQ